MCDRVHEANSSVNQPMSRHLPSGKREDPHKTDTKSTDMHYHKYIHFYSTESLEYAQPERNISVPTFFSCAMPWAPLAARSSLCC